MQVIVEDMPVDVLASDVAERRWWRISANSYGEGRTDTNTPNKVFAPFFVQKGTRSSVYGKDKALTPEELENY